MSVFLHEVKTPLLKVVTNSSPTAETALILGSFLLLPNKSFRRFAVIFFAKNLFSFKSKKPVLIKNSSPFA